MVVEVLLDVFHVRGRDILYGIRVFAVYVFLEEAIPLCLGFGDRGNFSAGSSGCVSLFAVLLVKGFPLFGVSSLGGKGEAGGKNSSEEQDENGADGGHDVFPFVKKR
jgi:hypothetical protein